MNEVRIFLESIEIVNMFQRVLVPVLMISAIGLFILVTQTRYGRIVDRIRKINYERRTMIKKALIERITRPEKIWNEKRLQCLQEQISILVRRGKLLKDSLKFLFIVIFTSITSSLLLFIEQIIRTKLSIAVLTLFVFGMIMLFMACVNVIKEVAKSYNAVIFDIDMYAPQGYRLKNELDIMAIIHNENK